jgi:hypothetical protein
VLISKASHGLEGTVKESSMNDLHRQLDVNFFGSDAITNAMRPYTGGGAAAVFPPWTPTTHQCTPHAGY